MENSSPEVEKPIAEQVSDPELTQELENSIKILEPELEQKIEDSVTNPEESNTNSNNNIDDIKFDEILDIDKIQEKLEEKLAQNNVEPDAESDSISAFELFELSKEKLKENAEEKKELPSITPEKSNTKKSDKDAKKYVVYIDPYNIDYMENLSLEERRSVINGILQEQKNLSIQQRQVEEKRRFIKHVIVATLTFIICFPILFIMVNRAMESVLINYKQSKENFSKLYREEGKVKMRASEAPTNINY